MTPKCVAHGGASAVARANSLAAFDGAALLGADMIEFDVRVHRGVPVLSHSALGAHRRGVVTLERALAHLAGPRFAGVELNVDLKQAGGEGAVLAALGRHDLLGRSLISSQCVAALDRVRALEPAARVGVSVAGRMSRVRQRWGVWREAVVEALRRRRFHALMLQHDLVDDGLVERARACGGEVYAWTVDDPLRMRQLAAAGVDGITTNDPRLFATLTASDAGRTMPSLLAPAPRAAS